MCGLLCVVLEMLVCFLLCADCCVLDAVCYWLFVVG